VTTKKFLTIEFIILIIKIINMENYYIMF